MHILQVLPTLDVGGVERGVVDLTKGLLRRGHQVTVVSAGGALVEPLTALGASHHAMPVDDKSPWSMWRCVAPLCRLIDETRVDLIHARSRVPAWIGYLASRWTQTPFVTTCHGFYRAHPASRVMTWGRSVVVPSQALGRYLIDRFGVPPERLRIIPRGVDLSSFRFTPRLEVHQGPWRIGLIGRLTPLKGHEVAIRALHQLVRQRLPVRLCVIGDAPPHKAQFRSRLEQVARSLQVAHAIDWLGTRGDIPELLASLDLLIAPSVYPESFGRTVIEAQAVGVPVVASRLGGLAETIEDGVTGLLAEPGNPTNFAQAVTRLIADEALRYRLIHQARARVEARFSVEQMVDSYEAAYREALEQPRLVVWKLSALGDLILATPSLRAIRRQFPKATISLVVGRPIQEAAARCPYVDEVLIYDASRNGRSLRSVRQLLRRIRRQAFDRSIDLQNSRWTHLLAWAAGIPVRIGYDRRWGRLLTRGIALPKSPMDPVRHQHHLLQQAGISPDGTALELWPSEADDRRVTQWLAEAGIAVAKPLVGLHPGASPRWATKRWDLARWAVLCDRLAQKGAQVVVTGSSTDRALGEALRGLARTAPLLMIGRTSLMELAALIRRCRVFVTIDSAPLHIASAVGTPAVALFGPTDPARHVPPSSAITVLSKKVFCSPCYSPRCRTVTHACMRRITVDEVFDAIESLLSQSPSHSITPSLHL